MQPEITVKNSNKMIVVRCQVKDSLHASLLSDQLNAKEYLKVINRKFNNGIAEITAYTIPALFTIQRLHDDLDTCNLIIYNHESVQDLQGE
jgi:hypothetical protein